MTKELSGEMIVERGGNSVERDICQFYFNIINFMKIFFSNIFILTFGLEPLFQEALCRVLKVDISSTEVLVKKKSIKAFCIHCNTFIESCLNTLFHNYLFI